ncbi:MAG: cytochrome c oxidase subunit 3 [Rhizobacter sp.]|nr:cytochrome c oxidase subunit 3 [Rhizobacter sp.]
MSLASATTAPAVPHRVSELDPGRLGMWVFLASELLFMGGLFAVYLWGRLEWPQGFGEASRHTHVWLGTLNTALLLTSSAVVAAAVACGEHEDRQQAGADPPRHAAGLLAAAASLGLAFLVVKGVEYRLEWHEHMVPGPTFALAGRPGAELFYMLYFTMTSLHALHVVAGVGVLSLLAFARRRRQAWATAHRVEVAALYWHFVDVVWIFLYPLLYLVERHP